MTWDDKVQARFSRRGQAVKWKKMYEEPTPRADEHFFRLRRDFTLQYVEQELAGARRILDLGCGSAPVLSELRARGRDCVGLDYSFEMLEHARDRIDDVGAPPTPLIQGDSRSLPFADQSFDAVVCLGVISYVKDYRPVLSELFRVLRPGGTVIVTFRNRFNKTLSDPVVATKTLVKKLVGWKEKEDVSVGRWLDHREVQRHLAEAGLVYLGFEGIGFGPPRFSYEFLMGNGRAAILLSDAMTVLLRAPGFSWLSKWLCDVSIWIYQRPHIDSTRVRAVPQGTPTEAVARGEA